MSLCCNTNGCGACVEKLSILLAVDGVLSTTSNSASRQNNWSRCLMVIFGFLSFDSFELWSYFWPGSFFCVRPCFSTLLTLVSHAQYSQISRTSPKINLRDFLSFDGMFTAGVYRRCVDVSFDDGKLLFSAATSRRGTSTAGEVHHDGSHGCCEPYF